MHNAKNIIKQDSILNSIMEIISGYNAYLVGGYIRDSFMGIKSFDRDLIIECDDVAAISKSIAKSINGFFVPLDTVNNIYRVVLEDKINYIDITTPIQNSIEKDILRRDLTINAIAYNLRNEEFIDITGGIEDIKSSIIKGISDKNFSDDPLRLLRIFRFNSKLGFKIDKHLIELTTKNAKLIHKSAKERINLELSKLFEGKNAHNTLLEMQETGLLEEIFPIVSEIKKIPPNSHHHLNLLNHSIETVKQVQKIYEDSPATIKTHLESPMGNTNILGNLKLAAFLHDIGKPQTWTIEEDTRRHRFIKHDDVGSNIVVPILKELKFSKKQISFIKKLIKYHIYPANIVTPENITEKAKNKFYRKMEGMVIEVIILSQSDRLSARGYVITEEIIERNISGLNMLLQNYLEKKDKIKPLEKLLDGNEIMKILDIKQTPTLGKIIKALYESQLEGDVTSKEEAIKFIKNFKY